MIKILVLSLIIFQVVHCSWPLSINFNELLSLLPFSEYFIPAPSKPILLSLEGDEETAKFLYPYASASYCTSDQITNWICPICNDSNKLEKIQFFQNNENNLSGYGGIRDSKIIFSIEGTDNLFDFVKDINSLTKDLNLNNGEVAQVHAGFYEATQSILDNFVNKFEILKAEYPDYPIYLTGHSLGGAIALLIAIELESKGIVSWDKLHIYTFGQPRVGDQVFANFLNTRPGTTFLRVTNQYDMIPNLPPRLLNYVHHQYIAMYDDNKRQECSQESEEEKCYSFYSVFRIEEHGKYFNSKLSDNCANSDLDLVIHGLSVVGDVADEIGLADLVNNKVGLPII